MAWAKMQNMLIVKQSKNGLLITQGVNMISPLKTDSARYGPDKIKARFIKKVGPLQTMIQASSRPNKLYLLLALCGIIDLVI